MNYHFFTKPRTGQSELCAYQTGSMTTEHVLPACPRHDNLGHQLWPVETLSGGEEAFGSLDDLQCTAVFVQNTGAAVE